MSETKFKKALWMLVATGLVAAVAVFVVFGGLGADSGLLPKAQGRATEPMSQPMLQVVATTTVFADLAANVGGDRVEVTSLIPIGADPHTWEPSSRQIRAVASADVFFYNGLGLEPWAQRTIANAGSPNLVPVRLSQGLEPIRGVSFHVHGQDHAHDQSHDHSHDHTHDHTHDHQDDQSDQSDQSDQRDYDGRVGDEDGDPHFWLDIANAMHYVRRIEQALTTSDPAGATYYKARSEQYLAELAELDRWFAAQIERIPAERRVLVTYHDAYAYMAKRYGLESVGFLVRNPDREPSPREMAELIRIIDVRDVRTIFAEPQVNPRFAETLAREAGVQTGILYTDALTEDVPTYVEMMRTNAQALVEGLGGD